METVNINQPAPPIQNIEHSQSAHPPNPSSHPKIFIIVLGIFLLMTLVVGIYVLGTKKNQTVIQNQQPISSPTASQPSPTNDINLESTDSAETANWKTYTNNKYRYLIRFPNEYDAEIYNGQSGEYKKAGSDNERIGIYQDRNDPYKGHFLEIQIVPNDKNSSLKELVEANRNKNPNNQFNQLSEKFSPLKLSQIAGNSSYEYSFKNTVLDTDYWVGVVVEDEYRVIFTEKNNIIYSIYSTDKDLINQILSTFKFLN